MKTQHLERTLAIGVTGGIGSGKSEVCSVFQSLGGKIYSSDLIARDLMNSDRNIRKRINTLFGKVMYGKDGTLDRKTMAKMIFSDESLKYKVNEIVHPVVIDYLTNVINTAKESKNPSLLFIESALIYDAGIEDMFDYVILILSNINLSIERVVKRDSANRNDVLHRVNAQLSPEKHRDKADFVIENNGDLANLKTKCAFIYSLLSQLN